MKGNICIQILCYLLILFSPAKAQWKTYTNTNYINNIVGDSISIYCATLGGFTIFSRSDSKFITTYTNVDGLPNNRIQSLAFDGLGNIWLGTYCGLAFFAPSNEKISIYPYEEISQNIINCLNRSGDTVLIGTQNGLYVIDTKGTLDFDDDTKYQPILPSAFSNKVFSVAATNDFWIGASPGVIKLNRDLHTYTQYSHPFGDSVKAMTVVLDTVYIATEQGIAKYSGSNFIPVVYFPQNYSVNDLKYSNNNFYIATTTGLLQYDGTNITSILNQDSRTILSDDGLWIGLGGQIAIGGGLKYYSNNNWFEYFSTGLASNNILCVVTDSLGTICATHFSLDYFGYRKISYKEPAGNWRTLYDTLINGNVIAIDKKNRIWLGHWFVDGGVSCYDPYLNIWSIRTWSSHEGVICALGIDRNDTKWIYNENGTVIAIDSLDQTIEFTIPGLGSVTERHGRGYEFTFDSQNQIWLASQNGLVMINYNNTLFDQSDDTYRIYLQGLPAQDVNSVAIDAENKIWCATAQGAAKLEGDFFQMYNTNNSLILDDKVIRIKTDSWGGVWFLTQNGLSYYNIYTKEWIRYTSENSGLIPNIENDSKFYEWLSINEQQGFLLVGTKEGLSQFFYKIPAPESLSQIRIYPDPFIYKEHQIITFDSLPKNSIIKIYSIEGKLITELNQLSGNTGVRWEPKAVVSGIYLAVVKSENETRIAKFAIVR
jgi:ligand-binding sensor domain-containing protein